MAKEITYRYWIGISNEWKIYINYNFFPTTYSIQNGMKWSEWRLHKCGAILANTFTLQQQPQQQQHQDSVKLSSVACLPWLLHKSMRCVFSLSSKVHFFRVYFVLYLWTSNKTFTLKLNSIDRKIIFCFQIMQPLWWIPHKHRPLQQFQQIRKSCNSWGSRCLEKFSPIWPNFQNGFQNRIATHFDKQSRLGKKHRNIITKKSITAFNAHTITNGLEMNQRTTVHCHFHRAVKMTCIVQSIMKLTNGIKIDVYRCSSVWLKTNVLAVTSGFSSLRWCTAKWDRVKMRLWTFEK